MRERLLAYPVDGEWQDLAYWDPLPDARAMTDSVGDGRCEDRSRLSLPGPFYAGVTYCGLNGPYDLPEHVLLGDDQSEFVHRQPADPREVAALVEIAHGEPMGGYGWYGDRHWTPEAVREWWACRGEVREWTAEESKGGGANDPAALRRYAAYLDDGLEAYLRGYVFWLTEGRQPLRSESLPVLQPPLGSGTVHRLTPAWDARP